MRSIDTGFVSAVKDGVQLTNLFSTIDYLYPYSIDPDENL